MGDQSVDDAGPGIELFSALGNTWKTRFAARGFGECPDESDCGFCLLFCTFPPLPDQLRLDNAGYGDFRCGHGSADLSKTRRIN